MPKKIPLLIFSIAVCLGAGVVGSFFTISAIPTWYATLHKPIFSPPNWVFGPVWTLLYILMGIALYKIVTSRKSQESSRAIRLFIIQLILNTLWSIIFFGLHNPVLAFVDIVALWITIVLTMQAFYKINKVAGNLLIPYILWVSFATILNVAIVILNP